MLQVQPCGLRGCGFVAGIVSFRRHRGPSRGHRIGGVQRPDGGVLPVKTGVAFIKPEAPLKPQKQVFVDAKATKTTFPNVSTPDPVFFVAGHEDVKDTCVFAVHMKAQTRAFEMKTNKNIL